MVILSSHVLSNATLLVLPPCCVCVTFVGIVLVAPSIRINGIRGQKKKINTATMITAKNVAITHVRLPQQQKNWLATLLFRCFVGNIGCCLLESPY
jgi:predicted transporter